MTENKPWGNMSGDNELEGKSQGVRSDRRISQELVSQELIS